LAPEDTQDTRRQLQAALPQVGAVLAAEYVAAERLVLFVRASLQQLQQLLELTDCVYEVELSTQELRDWLIVEGAGEPPHEIPIQAPSADAPSVVVLDTGIAAQHPLLVPVLLNALSVVPGDPSPADTHGHGTNMSGIGAYDDLGQVITNGQGAATHWVESARILVAGNVGAAAPGQAQFWPSITQNAVTETEATGPRRRVFVLAVTAALDDPSRATSWSDAVDRLAFNGGDGRLLVVSIGNADYTNVNVLNNYPQQNLTERLDDPSQAANALTIGGYTLRSTPPPQHAAYVPVAPIGALSPHGRCGLVLRPDAIKPDVVFEAGNVGFDGQVGDAALFAGLTTHYQFQTRLFDLMFGTSEAAAHAGWFIGQLLREVDDATAQTIRGLVVHSASWTPAMIQQFSNLDERLAAFGLGVPELPYALGCLANRATIVIQDTMPNAEIARVQRANPGGGFREVDEIRRYAKVFRVPLPEDLLLEVSDSSVRLRVTLSYFAEPNTIRGRTQRGLDLRWDMQGPQESEDQFLQRINRLARGQQRRTDQTSSFDWELGLRRRSRGTVQSDRWRGTAAYLAGDKLIAVYPALGWWDRREQTRQSAMPFSLLISVESDGVEIYAPIQATLTVPVEIET